MYHGLLRLALACSLSLSTLEAAEDTTASLFENAIEATGDDYVELRTTLLVREDLAMVLTDVKAGEPDWQHQVLADALAGWRQNPELYKELWVYQPPRNMYRNQSPLMMGMARFRFEEEGEPIVPLILELIWKKHETLRGALPALVAEYQLELGLPGLVDCLSRGIGGHVHDAVASFGAKATPLLVAALPGTERHGRMLIAITLGKTGDPDAAAPLQQLLLSEEDPIVYEAECEALAALQSFAFLRDQLASPDTVRSPVHLAKALRADDSDETTELLLEVAQTSPHRSLRVEAFESVLANATETRFAALCGILLKEPDERARDSMVLYLGAYARYQPSDVIRDTLIEELDDPSGRVRVQAIYGLMAFDEASVTGKLLPFVSANTRLQRRAALYVLKDRVDDRIAAAVIPLLENEDPATRGYAADALLVNPSEESVEPLGVRLLEDDVEDVRRRAAQALGGIGGDEALQLLRQALLEEREQFVRATIESGIRQLEAQRPAP